MAALKNNGQELLRFRKEFNSEDLLTRYERVYSVRSNNWVLTKLSGKSTVYAKEAFNHCWGWKRYKKIKAEIGLDKIRAMFLNRGYIEQITNSEDT